MVLDLCPSVGLSDPSIKDFVTRAGIAKRQRSGPHDCPLPYRSIYISKELASFLVPALTASSWAAGGGGRGRQLVRVKRAVGVVGLRLLGRAP